LGYEIGYVKDDNLNFECLAIRDQTSGDTLEIQRALEFDDQDAALGMATYCIARNGRSHYGGLVHWSLRNTTLTLGLDEHAAATLELPLVTQLEVSASDAELISDYLPRLFNGQPSE
jgi:hypothetical protein